MQDLGYSKCLTVLETQQCNFIWDLNYTGEEGEISKAYSILLEGL